ncbi:helicase HerA-like domain-containing protein [uncultured Methanomethylovorans sp.]|uniref:ATP-binding protein n=1 Tax=uncultured Methanomethylovorans sp. TaxID=183759 RepID=UPI002AA7E8F9|nr:helicase HerA-like domain-containing protein [uncultured Methanomethylovorans sp.]
MTWIVIGREKDKVKLVSKTTTKALLPKGSYLTITEPDDCKFILRVEDSYQDFPYSPSPMIVDMELEPLKQDQKCQNIVYALPIKDLNERKDGLINFIKPLSTARRSNQEEVNLAMGYEEENKDMFTGPKVFLATIHGTQNQILTDDDGNMLTAYFPKDFFYHQILVCGKTGSGKTVCTKNFAQHFVEKMGGAVLAINVKEFDFLTMDKPSNDLTEQIKKEWDFLGEKAKGLRNFAIYYPSIIQKRNIKQVNSDLCTPITLDVTAIEPNSLNGILQNVSDIGAQYLPDIFRYWKEDVVSKKETSYFKFNNFVEWFAEINKRDKNDNKNLYPIKNSRGDKTEVPLHSGTATNILRNLNISKEYFDDKNAKALNGEDILDSGMMSVIDIEKEEAKIFGSILLRHLLQKIVELKSSGTKMVPVLIIIDEVHQFYNTESSKEALGALDTICRQGRSQEIAVIFSSQNPSDIPKGLSNVINTKIFFKSDVGAAKAHGISITDSEMESLKRGYCIANIHDLSQLKVMKFPLSLAGVIKRGE